MHFDHSTNQSIFILVLFVLSTKYQTYPQTGQKVPDSWTTGPDAERNAFRNNVGNPPLKHNFSVVLKKIFFKTKITVAYGHNLEGSAKTEAGDKELRRK